VVLVLYSAPGVENDAYERPYWVEDSEAPAADIRAEGAQRASWVVVEVGEQYPSGAVVRAVATA
jgi:hypothetical protein